MSSRSDRRAAARMRLPRGLIVILAGLPAAAGSAQAPDLGTAQVNVARANFRAACSLDADVVAALLEGAEVEILAEEGEWYRVRHLATGIEGCLHHSVIGEVMPSQAELEKQRREAEARAAAEREAAARAVAEREAAARAAALEAERRREAAVAAREEERERTVSGPERTAPGGRHFFGYLDFNLGYTTPAVDGMTYSGPVTQGSPPREIPGSRADSSYSYDNGLTFGVAGGFLRALASGGGIGAGVSLTRATYAVDLDLQASRPHRTLPSAVVEDEITASGPDREETAVHLHFIYAPPTAEQWRVRLFLGPSFFRSELPLWSAFVARFPVNPPGMEIQSVEFSTQEESVVGGHVGGDLAYFFSDMFGVGASGVYSQATGEVTVELPDAEESLSADFDLGGVAATLGLRLRF